MQHGMFSLTNTTTLMFAISRAVLFVTVVWYWYMQSHGTCMVLHVLACGKQDLVNFIVGVESKPKGRGLTVESSSRKFVINFRNFPFSSRLGDKGFAP